MATFTYNELGAQSAMFIDLIKIRPAIWDKRVKEHSDSIYIGDTWVEIAKTIGKKASDVPRLKEIFKSMRLKWRKMSKDYYDAPSGSAAPEAPDWDCFYHLQFLDGVTAKRKAYNTKKNKPSSNTTFLKPQKKEDSLDIDGASDDLSTSTTLDELTEEQDPSGLSYEEDPTALCLTIAAGEKVIKAADGTYTTDKSSESNTSSTYYRKRSSSSELTDPGQVHAETQSTSSSTSTVVGKIKKKKIGQDDDLVCNLKDSVMYFMSEATKPEPNCKDAHPAAKIYGDMVTRTITDECPQDKIHYVGRELTKALGEIICRVNSQLND